MPIEVQSLLDLDPALVDSNFSLMSQLVQERFPEIDLKRGVVHDVIVYLSGVLGSVSQQNFERLLRSASLKAIEADPTLADDEIVDRVLSNYRLTRQEASQGTGTVTIVLDSLFPVNIPSGTSFEANGRVFRTQTAYAVRTSSASVTSDNDRILQPVGDGTFIFQVDVLADLPGVLGVRRGARVEMPVPPPRFVRAYAEDDFIDGREVETNAQLLTKLQEGIAAKAYSNRTNITALVREQEAFASLIGLSIVGFGDAEMIRDQHSILPISLGGRTDIYYKGQKLYQSETMTRTAVLIEKNTDGSGIWQFSLTRAEASGVYDVDLIVLPTAPEDQTSGYDVVSDTRSVDLSGSEFLPDVDNITEGAYSSYQAIIIQFHDTDTMTTALTAGTSTKEYRIVVRKMPKIAELQEFLANRGRRNPAGDILVRAAIPCFLNVNFDIRQESSAEAPDEEAIQNAVAEAVNALGFPSQLHASMLVDRLHDLLPEGSWIANMDMFGMIRRPDGTVKYIRDGQILVIPDEPEKGVTGRTTTFYLDPRDVGISVVAATILEI